MNHFVNKHNIGHEIKLNSAKYEKIKPWSLLNIFLVTLYFDSPVLDSPDIILTLSNFTSICQLTVNRALVDCLIFYIPCFYYYF